MTIRRFPWRIPRLCDRSFKLFAQHRGLLKLLPREVRPVMTGILELDPKKRWTLDKILQDDWVKQIDVCTVDEPGQHHVHHVSMAATDCHDRNNLIILTNEPPGVVAEKERKRILQQQYPRSTCYFQNNNKHV